MKALNPYYPALHFVPGYALCLAALALSCGWLWLPAAVAAAVGIERWLLGE